MKEQQSRDERIQQSEDFLDREIELMRNIMMKVSLNKTLERKKSSSSRRKTVIDCESVASGARHHKIWRPGEKQQTTIDVNEKLQNKVLDPGRQGLKAYD